MENDEIRIIEYVKLLANQWKIIFILGVLGLSGAFIYSISQPKVYKISAFLDINSSTNSLPEIKEKVDRGIYDGFSIMAENIKDTGFIELFIESRDVKEDKARLDEFLDRILIDQNQEFENQKFLIRNNLEEAESTLNFLKKNKAYNEGIAELQLQVIAWRNQLKEMKPSAIIKAPTIGKYPISPRPLRNVALGGLIGVFLGIFWVLFRNWWKTS